MKSKEEISRRLEDLKKTRSRYNTEMLYLDLALRESPLRLKNLWCKYTLEVQEDLEILEALN